MFKKRIGQLRYVKHPLQIYRLLTNSFLNRPSSIELAINYVCNKRCPGCYAASLRAEQEKMFLTPKDVKEICDKYKPAHINITGGEPLLNPNLFDILRIIPKSVIVSMVTNDDLLIKVFGTKTVTTKGETAWIIKSNGLKMLKELGLNTIQLSYGSNYNMQQNEMLAFLCKKAGLNVCLSVTNVYKERENIKNAIKLGETFDYHILWNTPGCGLEKEFDYQTYFTYRNHPLVREDNLFWNGKDVCPAGTKKFYISADKSIYPCDRMHDEKYDSYEKMKKVYKQKRKVYCHRYRKMCDEK